MLSALGWILVMVTGTAVIVWGAELFAEHLAAASARLGVTTFALALLLAGAEPEELATVATASARGVDGVAFGDVIGANAAIVTVALAAGALVATMPFGKRVRRYGLGGLLAALIAGAIIWDGNVSRPEGALLVAGYIAFVATIWILERQPPALGETGELDEQRDTTGKFGREIALVVIGLAAITGGSVALVESVRQLSGVESTQTQLGLITVGVRHRVSNSSRRRLVIKPTRDHRRRCRRRGWFLRLQRHHEPRHGRPHRPHHHHRQQPHPSPIPRDGRPDGADPRTIRTPQPARQTPRMGSPVHLPRLHRRRPAQLEATPHSTKPRETQIYRANTCSSVGGGITALNPHLTRSEWIKLAA